MTKISLACVHENFSNRINYDVVHLRFIAVGFLCTRPFVLLWVIMAMSIVRFGSPSHFLYKYLSMHETAFSFESCVAMLHQSYFKQLMKLLHFTNMTVFLLEPEK